MAREHSDGRANGAKRPRRRFRLLLAAVLVLLLLLGIGFGRFLATLPSAASDLTAQADGIVALTGEGSRLAPAVTLLEKGSGKRLLITGVNPQTSKPYLKKLLHGGDAFDCCADLGFVALDTRGNAQEPGGIRRADARRGARSLSRGCRQPQSRHLGECATAQRRIRKIYRKRRSRFAVRCAARCVTRDAVSALRVVPRLVHRGLRDHECRCFTDIAAAVWPHDQGREPLGTLGPLRFE